MTSSSAQPARPASPLSSPLQRPQLAQTTLLSPYHQCFRLGVQSYTPAPHSPDTRRWPPNPRTPSRPAQGSWTTCHVTAPSKWPARQAAPPPLLHSKALQLAKLYGWRLIIDAFASESNSLLPRFFAPYAEPAAESEDAFTACDWDQSTCPKCGLAHREALFAYLPPALLNRLSPKHRRTRC